MIDLAGQKLGNYLILEKVGEGGMGSVYRARDVVVGRTVAIKVLSDRGLQSSEYLERFRREYLHLASLDHPNLARIYDVTAVGGLPCFVMRFCPGGSLEDLLHAGPGDRERLLGILEKVAQALGVVHKAGLVHRDVKPSNIMLDERGEPVLVDFGLVTTDHSSRELTQFDTLTRENVMVGTPHYMAPEQVLGHREAICPATDVHAMGVILYRVLYGVLPFRERSGVELALSVVNRVPSFPDGPSLPLRVVCSRCLEKDPARRYPNGAALAVALGGMAGFKGMIAHRILGRPRLGRRTVLVSALLGLAAAASWAFLGLFERLEAEKKEKKLQAARLERMADRLRLQSGYHEILRRLRTSSLSAVVEKLESLTRIGGAAEFFAEERRRSPGSVLPHYALYLLHAAAGRRPDARTHLRAAAGRDPRLGLLHGIREIVWAREGSEMVLVRPGWFAMGADEREWRRWQIEFYTNPKDRPTHTVFRNESPRHMVHLDTYYIDKHPVTWGRFARFLAAVARRPHPTPWCHRDCMVPHHDIRRSREVQTDRGVIRCDPIPGDHRRSRLPVVSVTWWDAHAYAAWAGKR